ncbi:MAG TPA: DUF429 domain-containing protein [Nitriliruptorales bacterium]|nr:DUF429 domain-containing protein [Nitriliruptorales bacterium]
MSGVRAAGLDGYRHGWFAVVLHAGRFQRADAYMTVADALTGLADCDRIGVDAPIGLVEHGAREADTAARGVLGASASSVFLTPSRWVLSADDYGEANRRGRESGRGVSRQAWALRARILELEALQPLPACVLEVHPEVAFRDLAGRRLPSKRSWTGVRRRLALLSDADIHLPIDVPDGVRARADDVLDAAVVAWVAAAPEDGLVSYPSSPEQEAHGRPIAIWSRRP